MAIAAFQSGAETFDHCRYDGSKLLLRGPRRNLDGAFVACLGGTETHARYIERPFPDLLEESLGVTCVNFGWPNAGIDVFRADPALVDCASRSQLCVLQVPNAINLSNMYYRVHPRRNDRVLEATDAMRALFPCVDFTEFSFTRHLLTRLRSDWPDAYQYLRKELAAVWQAGMQDLLSRIDAPVVLLWLSARRPEEKADQPHLAADPGLVTREMLEHVRPLASGIVEVLVDQSGRGLDAGDVGLKPSRAESVLNAQAHLATADALTPTISGLLQTQKGPPLGRASNS
jgi:hypothetical protein